MNANWMGPMGMKDGMKPWADLMTMGGRTLEELTKAHMEAMTEMFETGMAHAKVLGTSRDFAAMGKAQADCMAEMGKQAMALAHKDMEIMTRAQTEMMSALDGAVREGVDKVRRTAGKAAETA